MYIYVYIYIQIYLSSNGTVKLSHARSNDRQGQDTFLTLSANNQTRIYETECSNSHLSQSI